METNSTLPDLKNKEKEIYLELQSSVLFKQWESLKTTIQLFENGNGSHPYIHTNSNEDIPSEYAAALTWADKVLFVLNRINEGFIEDIVNEIQKFETGSPDRETIVKRVRGNVSILLNKKKLRIVKKDGRKNKLTIK